MPQERTLDTPRRRPGRPARPVLTQGDIAREALAIIDELGWHACTMKLLAHRLGVRAPSLYHHIDGQAALVSLVRALVVSEIHDPTIVDLPWDEAVRRFGIAYYRAFVAHPNTVQVLSTTPVRDSATIAMYETFMQVFVREGGELHRALEALIGLETLALGFAFDWNAEDLMLDPILMEAAGAPLLAEATRERTDQNVISETSFLRLLDRYIEMFRHEFDHARAGNDHLAPLTLTKGSRT